MGNYLFKEPVREPIKENLTLTTANFTTKLRKFPPYFFNDTDWCDSYEYKYQMCRASPIQIIEELKVSKDAIIPSIDIANTTIIPSTNGTTTPEMIYWENFYIFLFIGICLLLFIVLIYFIYRLFIFNSNKQSTKKTNINTKTTDTTILIVGANETGKKSIITSFKRNYPKSNTWNFLTQKFSQHKIPTSPTPDLIWLVVNYQSSIHDNEFEILKYTKNIPVVLIVNKVDVLQELNINDENLIKHFNLQIPNFLEKYERLINIRQRLIPFNKHFLILSLRQEENTDKKIGINNLIEITNEYLPNRQSLFQYNGIQHELESIHDNTEMKNQTIKILLIGYSSTGKSSLINCFAGKTLSPISLDGLPMTKNIQEYFLSNLNLILIDTIGLEKKRDNIEKFEKIKHSCQPDFIWFIINYQSSIEQDELNLINQLFPLIPTIIILNFMDILQTFDYDIDFESDIRQNNQQYEMEKKRLLQFKQNHTNIRHIVAISLRSEEEGDKPRGLKLLYEQTIQNFSNKQCSFS